jgi:hypothetical protein
MNEQIRRFMEQAIMHVDGELFGKTHIPDEFTEKFAELIIKECADVATVNQYQAFTPGHYVKKHFGVEE